MAVVVPAQVQVNVENGSVVVKGPKGELRMNVVTPIKVSTDAGRITVTRPDDARHSRQRHGLVRTLVANMVDGVTNGFSKVLEIHGVGYRAQMQGRTLSMQLGFSHAVTIEPPAGITLAVEGPNRIVVSGADKQRVGQIAAEIRNVRPPEPYKGKGIRYRGEAVRRKAGKTAKGGKK
jgi:large subunit ribosomal protein L6